MVALLENLIKARKEAGLTQEKLSQLAGVDRSTLAHIGEVTDLHHFELPQASLEC